MITVSSQRFLDDAIVERKVEDGDFEVLVSPEFEFDGQAMRVVLDGHHSFAAAKQAGTSPVYVTATQQEHDAVALIERGEIEDFLAVTHMGDDYYDIETGHDVW